MKAGLFRISWAVLLWIAAPQVTLAAPPCVGDCDQQGAVTVDEILKGIGIALGNTAVDECLRMDGNSDRMVTVDEVVNAVTNALSGCPSFVGEYFGTVDLDAGRRATISLTAEADGQASALVEISEQGSTLARLLRRGGAAPLFSFSISGSIDLDTGAFTLSGSFVEDGETRNVDVNGTLPLPPAGAGTLDFQLDSVSFSGAIASGRGATPTPTATRPAATAAPTATATPMSSGPVDPDMLGTWSGTASNQSTGAQKAVRIKIELQGSDVVVTDLGGNLYKIAPAAITMSAPTRTTLVYNKLTGNPFITFNLTLGGAQLAGIYAATTVSNPPMVEAFGLVLTKEVPLAPDPRLAGTWSGMGTNNSGVQRPVRLRLELQSDAVVVTDLLGDLFVHIPSSITARLDGAPTFLAYVCDTGPSCGAPANPVVSVNLSLLASGRLVGAYFASLPGGAVDRVNLNLGKE